MPISSLVWACIECGTEGGIGADNRCRHCGAAYRRGRAAQILVQRQGSAARSLQPREIVRLLPKPGTTGGADVQVQEWTHDKRMYALGRYLGRIDYYGPWRTGKLVLADQLLRFNAEEGASFEIAVLDITAVQPGSHAIQIKTPNQLVSIRFLNSSAFLWEERLHAALRDAYEGAGLGEVADFLPRVSGPRGIEQGVSGQRIRRRINKGSQLKPERPPLYRVCSWIARTIWQRLGGGMIVTGAENIPERGPFMIVVNHQSYLEPMLVPAVLPRPVNPMAKTTQFTVPFFGWLMAQVFAFPVRRFETDPNAVRYSVKRLSEGHGLLVFPEGERSWDGEAQPMRVGALRLARLAGVPVIPCRVEGAYEAWPRWSSTPQRHPIKMTFGRPLEIPADADAAARLVRSAINESRE